MQTLLEKRQHLLHEFGVAQALHLGLDDLVLQALGKGFGRQSPQIDTIHPVEFLQIENRAAKT